ncbi:hypothetical protein ACHAXA_009685 [Cyclostephanos tholiformis]|uniref:PIN domain-containing protein n=1 Tax=Cyclostephanos tholiformis TaxID=382380 RepID=A0ABD3RLU7_9STRA
MAKESTLQPDITENELLQSFFDDVEKLSIHHDASAADGGIENEGKGDSIIYSDGSDDGDGDHHPNNTIVWVEKAKKKPPSNAGSTSKQCKEKRREMIANADVNRGGWSEFKKINHSSNNDCGGNEGKGPMISFQIASSVKNRKKNQSDKATGEKEKQMDQESDNQLVGRHGNLCSERTSYHHWRNVDDDTGHTCPIWTLIIDTCCLIENDGTDVKNLILLALNASDARTKAQRNQQNSALMTTIVDEPIHIVIPNKVWSELEFQSKSKSPETNIAYAARRAIRMLRDELESQGTINGGVLRSQSLLEARAGAAKFLLKDTKSTNDDHILVCAMMESERYENDSSASCTVAGGVVVVTLDGNLACKAISNGLKVYSPTEFHVYYRKRMSSLRERALGRLAESALRR